MTSSTSSASRLNLIANLSIFTIGLGFSVRASIADDLRSQLFDLIDPSRSATMVGEALGITFGGFALTLLLGSALVDWIGCKKMLISSAVAYLIGSVLVMTASIGPIGIVTYYQVLCGLLLTGLGWGAVEAAANPMVLSIDPDNKIKRLNILHAWWPAGIVAGGLIGLLLRHWSMPWQTNLIMLMLPPIVLLILLKNAVVPATERVAIGVSYIDMFKELYKKPAFFLFWACMWLTASSELAPGQWVDLALSKTVGMSGMVILIYVSFLMFVMRHFAGTLTRHISSIGLLWFSSLLAAVGLYGLSLSNSPLSALCSATIWGIGVCFMWPTMLAVVSERFPRGGALFLGMMGFGGGMAIQFLLPHLGKIFDDSKIRVAGGLDKFAELTAAQSEQVLKIASAESFQAIAYVPLILLPIFGGIWLFDKYATSTAGVSSAR